MSEKPVDELSRLGQEFQPEYYPQPKAEAEGEEGWTVDPLIPHGTSVDVAALRAENARLTRELAEAKRLLTTAGIVEIAARNPSVMEWVTNAEKEADAARRPPDARPTPPREAGETLGNMMIRDLQEELAVIRYDCRSLNALVTQRNADVARLTRERDEAREKLNETWTDEHGIVWTRPTAWAYAQSCRTLDAARAEVARLREASKYPCHRGPQRDWCDHAGLGGFMGHTCIKPDTSPRALFMAAIAEELDHAYRKHGRDSWGRHEFFAILLEEVDELKDAVWKDAPQEEVLAEARQVAAMCFRYVETGDRYRGEHPSVPRRALAAPPKVP